MQKLASSPLQKLTYPLTAFAKGFGRSARTIPRETVNGIASIGRNTARRAVDVVKNPMPFVAGQAKQWAANTAATAVHPALGAAVSTYNSVPWAQVADTGRAIGRTTVRPFDAGFSRSLRLQNRLKPSVVSRLATKVDNAVATSPLAAQSI
jgi:hypothetical protein